MTIHDPTQLIPLIVAGVVGFAAGKIVELRQTTVRGRKVSVPQVTRSSRNFTIVVLVLSLLTVTTVIQSGLKQAEQDGCNAEFKRVIATNSGASADALRVQDDLWVDIRDLFSDDARAISPGQIRLSIDRYLAARSDAQQTRAANPYPDPQCF